MIPNTTPPGKVLDECRGVILGGGPSIERAGNSSRYLDLGLPVLGICLGLHIIASKFGGIVHQGLRGGYGPIEVEICEHDDILSGYPDTINVWSSHADEVLKIPEGFTCLAYSAICTAEAIARHRKTSSMGSSGILKSVIRLRENGFLKILTGYPWIACKLISVRMNPQISEFFHPFIWNFLPIFLPHFVLLYNLI